MHGDGDWVVAAASVLAALIGIAGGYLLAIFQRERQKLQFTIYDAEDLAAGLRQHGNFQVLWAASAFTTTELILSTIAVRNFGNCTIENLEFTLTIEGERHFSQITAATNNLALMSQIRVSSSNPPLKDSSPGIDWHHQVKLPYFNAGEEFRINALYSGKPCTPGIICRLPNTTVNVISLAELQTQLAERRERLTFKLAALVPGLFMMVLVLAIAVFLRP